MLFRPALATALAALCAAAASDAHAGAVVLLDDTFADGNRGVQDPPASAEWFLSSSPAVTVTPGNFQYNNSGNRLLVGYFTPVEAPTLLPAGESITLEITFSSSVAPISQSNGFNLALLNSGGTRIAANLSSVSDAAYSNYAGYGTRTSGLGSTSGSNLVLRERLNPDNALMSTTGAWSNLTSGNGTTGTAVANVTYVATLTIINNGATASLNYSVKTQDGLTTLHSLSANDTSTVRSTFDTVALYIQSGQFPSNGTITLHRIKVALSAAGEPASAPQFDVHPQSQSVTAGGNVTLTAHATGNPEPSLQWRKNGDDIPGETGVSLTFTGVTPDDAGNYTVVATNIAGNATSEVATLTVNSPPSISTQPAGLTVLVGGTANFTVSAGGTTPLSYQWFKGEDSVANATASTLSLANVTLAATGNYTVIVSNIAGNATSDSAQLIVSASPIAPSITTPPAPFTASQGGTATFTVVASGTAPLSYQWKKDNANITNATSSTLVLGAVQPGDAGNYSVVVSNSAGNATGGPAQLTVHAGVPLSRFSLTGFATSGGGTTGGGIIPETDPGYRKVYTPLDFANAIQQSNKTAGAVKVIEIMNDLDLGWNEVGDAVRNLSSNPFRSHATPKLHPRLLVTGVSVIDIKAKSGLTIFSANGATIRHANLNIKDTSNIIIRNLKFDELWEWDEASKGDYDGNDWDFITLGNGGTAHNVWIDHCTFTKVYDGVTDIKGGAYEITFSWNKVVGDDGATNPNSFVRQQVAALEADRPSRAMYNFLRTNGFSIEDIVTIVQGQQKLHLIGATSLNAENADHRITFHHQWWMNPWDRLPRLRAGNVHNYNNFADAVLGLAAKRLRDTRANAMSSANRSTLNNTYSFNPFLNGSISTENGAILVEKSIYLDCLTPLRNNQTDPSDPTYTGKVLALDTIYQFHQTNGTLTVVRGNSTDPGNPLGPTQAPVIPFSWNLPGNALPYSYVMDEPDALPGLLAAGAGAGIVTWSKDNWLKTAYSNTFSAPSFTAQPAATQTVSAGGAVTFTAAASSAAPFGYQWYKDGDLLPGKTSPSLTLTNLQPSDAGAYTVRATNAAGFDTSGAALLTVTQSFNAWAAASGLPSGGDGLADDANGDGVPNLVSYFLGLDPMSNDRSGLPDVGEENDDLVFRFTRSKSAVGVTHTVQLSADLLNWTTAPGAPVLESETATQETYALPLPGGEARFYVRLRVTAP